MGKDKEEINNCCRDILCFGGASCVRVLVGLSNFNTSEYNVCVKCVLFWFMS